MITEDDNFNVNIPLAKALQTKVLTACVYFLSIFDIQAEGLRYISQRQIKQMMTMMTGLVEAGGVLSGNSDSYMLL